MYKLPPRSLHTNTKAGSSVWSHYPYNMHMLKTHTVLLNDVRGALLQDRHVCQDCHNLEKRIEKLRKWAHLTQEVHLTSS